MVGVRCEYGEGRGIGIWFMDRDGIGVLVSWHSVLTGLYLVFVWDVLILIVMAF